MEIIFNQDSEQKNRTQTAQNGSIFTKFIVKISGGRITSQTAISQSLLIITVVAIILSVIIFQRLVIVPPAEPILSPYDG